jgi:peptidyl-tRNA hydrolase, PTH1 family
MKLIVGLGNPGLKYEGTRHNIGFMALDHLRERIKFSDFRNESKFKSEISRGEFNGEKVILIKPQTFMNLSGDGVLLVKQFYKIDSKDIWVAYDDVDLNLGVLRIRFEGSAGTHNGMKSLIQCLGTEFFTRFRLGIETRGESSPIHQDVASFVLERFKNEELPQVNELLSTFSEAAVLALKKGGEAAQNMFSH